jgi:mannose-6-phosphate isomerase
MFLPSGRVHAIGAGLVIFEIQQNSDTTFRVYDWDRLGLDGKPRELHIEQSLKSIDFTDVEPALISEPASTIDDFSVRPLVRDALFSVDLMTPRTNASIWRPQSRVRVLACVNGRFAVSASGLAQTIAAGQFCLIPAAASDVTVNVEPGAAMLVAQPGNQI